jgi:CHAT domain-containing protein
LNSGLILAGATNFIQTGVNPLCKDDGGLLTAYEAMNLDLEGTELVTLSACKTGLGHQRNGEGVYGLQQAFYLAGAKMVVMSLWQVHDQATRDLVSVFYREWTLTRNTHQSFREAQRQVMLTYPSRPLGRFCYDWNSVQLLKLAVLNRRSIPEPLRLSIRARISF